MFVVNRGLGFDGHRAGVCAVAAVLVGLQLGCAGSAPAPASQPLSGETTYMREELWDTTVHRDEALVNVRVRASRWPDCTTLGTFVEDVFRLEAVTEGSDQDKALALWKWHRILMSTSGPAPFEGPADRERRVSDPHKLLTAYGRHHCEGQGKVMAGSWRAAGYMALDECSYNHTTAALRYRDADGAMRYHTFDPQLGVYYWDPGAERVGTRSVPVMYGKVYRHLTAPRTLHSLRTSLRVGETLERRWDNGGRAIPHGKKEADEKKRAALYTYPPKGRKTVYAIVGEEVQTLEAETRTDCFAGQLFDGSVEVACSPAADGKAALHPAAAGKLAAFVYRLASPFPAAEARLEATLLKGRAEDVCRLSVSRDGRKWLPVFVKERPGEEKVLLEIGRRARRKGRPEVFTACDFFVRAEFETAGDPRAVGMSALKVTAFRMLGKRCLPCLRPGDNWWEVSADRLAEGFALELTMNYRLAGEDLSVVRVVREFPHYFRVDAPVREETALKGYDWDFNTGPLRMKSLRMRLVATGDGVKVQRSLPAAEARPRFAAAYPYPAEMDSRRNVQRAEKDPAETGGFFPQSRKRIEGPPPAELLEKLKSGKQIDPAEWERTSERWLAAEELGNYPQAVDALCAKVASADGDLLLFLCKALAQIGDPKAVEPLLAKWKKARRCQPGSRYIPDALAATGDRSVVPELVAPLGRLRFDFRLHIARALGVLGGPEAERVLAAMAASDPFPAVKQEALEALARLKAAK
ncbi:MAG: HEAT repeat domain-containing protein [Planctomycetota bacterium]|jgi:hypothetical protein